MGTTEIAMKFVLAYQRIRHNNFVARRFADAKGVEAVGNFLLTPAHFLFAGRTITYVEKNKSYNEKQTYDYTKCFWLKTVAAILTLPISLILGGIFKGISLLTKSVRNRNADWAANRFKIESHEKIYEEIGLKITEEEVKHQNVLKPTREELAKIDPPLAFQHKALHEALQAISIALKGAQIPYWLDCGTALGAYRHGGIIPWDPDIDISVLDVDHMNVMNALQEMLDPKKYEVFDSSGLDKPNSFVRVYIKESDSYVDICEYAINREEGTAAYIFSQENSCGMPERLKKRERPLTKPLKFNAIFPLKQGEFDGLKVNVPNDLETFLKSKYGNNLDPARVWNKATKSYDPVPNHPYYLQSDT